MVETPAPEKELRYRHVSIHSQGKTEHGTLYLLKHHACFAYQAPSQPGSGKFRPKEIWIPYPMIAFCVLRPSHAATFAARPSGIENPTQAAQTGDELFPPSFGTSGYERPSTDSARLAPFSTPPRPSSPSRDTEPSVTPAGARQPVIRIRRKDFQMMALHFNSGEADMSTDQTARQAFYALRKRSCIDKIQALHAFHYQPHKDESRADVTYDARKEFARMGVSSKAADGPGTAWRISDINQDYSYSRTYPNVLCVPKAVSDNTLKYGGPFRSKSRIPCLSYLHSNGGSITRSSQPMVGARNKRNPQDERLVSAIFSSHTPTSQSPEDSPPQVPSLTSPSSATLESSSSEPLDLDSDATTLPTSQSETALDEKVNEKPIVPRVYGSTRQNVIVDARPLANVVLNRVAGGGVEDTANYRGSNNMPVEKVYLNIANIHVMRKSLDKVIESFGSADYVDMQPNHETLRKSGWLGHIAGLLEGSEMVARVVGLGGSHALVHCSDGWDRTSQVAALAQIMLDPYYRTLDGFTALVQKDFLSFGHKFRDRDGIEGSEKWFDIENEKIEPSRTREGTRSDPNSFNAIGQKAFSGAKNWFQKGKGNLFTQQNESGGMPGEAPGSRSSSPPPNPLIHSPPSSTSKDEKETHMKPDEVSPVFHQFLDAVFQILYQQPNAFECNERFLKRLFYHAYACQYGEFLFNNEKDRSQYKLPSVWGHFLSRRQDFTNPEYLPKVDDPLLFPKRRGVEREVGVRWWAGLFGRKDEDMNLPRALAPADQAPHTAPLRPSVSFEEPATVQGDESSTTQTNGGIKETKSTPSLAAMRDTLTNSFSSMTFRGPEASDEPALEPKLDHSEFEYTTDADAQDQTAQVQPAAEPEAPTRTSETSKFDQMDMDDGDPLGVSPSAPKQVVSSRMDFAAFASQNAFRDR